MQILLADKLDPMAASALKEAGFTLVKGQGLSAAQLTAEAALSSILIVRSTQVTLPVMKSLPALKLIIRAGAGVDTIDMAAAFSLGIQVSNCPGKNADAVAEIALGLILAVDRSIVAGTLALRQGQWNKGALGQGRGLKGRVLGLVGFGAVAKALARKALALDMEVMVWSRNLNFQTAQSADVKYASSLDEIAQISDIVSIHLAANSETQGLIGASFFSAMKPAAIFINTARGEIVNRAALLEAIRSRGIRVGLDVYADEPKTTDGVFRDAELAALTVCTPHLGASTDQAAEAVAQEVVRIAMAYRRTGIPPNAIANP